MPVIDIDTTVGENPWVAPEGTYLCKIKKTEVLVSKKGVKYLVVTHEIVEGDKKDIEITKMIFLWSENPKAQWMAKRAYESLWANSLGRKPAMTEELHGKLIKCVVGIERNAEFGDKNTIESYLPVSAVTTPANKDDDLF